MKKVIFCIGAMLIAATGFSQNESLIDQGKQNIADVNQVSTVDLYNFSDVYQRGENDADIDQIGQNSSIVEQHGQNFAIVYQDGGDGWNNLIQESEVVQRGKNNLADIEQFGERNQSYVDQANDGNTYGEGTKKGNKAKIYQEGNRNFSDVGQKK